MLLHALVEIVGAVALVIVLASNPTVFVPAYISIATRDTPEVPNPLLSNEIVTGADMLIATTGPWAKVTVAVPLTGRTSVHA